MRPLTVDEWKNYNTPLPSGSNARQKQRQPRTRAERLAKMYEVRADLGFENENEHLMETQLIKAKEYQPNHTRQACFACGMPKLVDLNMPPLCNECGGLLCNLCCDYR